MKKHLISLVALSAMMLVGCGENAESSTSLPASSVTESTPADSSLVSSVADSSKDSSKDSTIPESSKVDSSINVSSEDSSQENSSVEDSSVNPIIEVTDISLNAQSGSLYIGQKVTLKATVAPENATDKTVTWTSSAHDVATVENGVVKAVGKGTCVITAKAGNHTATYSLTVNDFSNVPNVYHDDGIINDGESSGAAGHMIYWFGEGAAVSSAERAENNEYSFTYTAGGQWWATQFFYKGLYQEAGDSYLVSLDLTSSVAGNITVNGNVLTMAINTTQTFIYEVKDANTLISIQLGENGKSVLGSGTFKLKVNGIYDTTSNASYHHVEFKNGEDVVKSLSVKDGKGVAAPADPKAPEGKLFDGWYNDENKWTAETVISADTTFVAKFSDANTAHTVTFYNGSTVLGSVSVADNNTIKLPDNFVYPFGYSAGKWFTDAELKNEFTLSTPVTEDLELHALLFVTPSATFDGYNGWNPISASALKNEDDGSLTLTYTSGLPVNYNLQINFILPIGEAGKQYKVTTVSKVSATGGDVQIFDNNATIGEIKQLGVNGTDYETTELIYNGGTLSAGNKLTFELGAVDAEEVDTFTFNLKSLKVEEYIPGPEVKANATSTTLTMGGESATVSLTASHFAANPSFSALADVTDVVEIVNNGDATFTISPKGVGTAIVTFKATLDDVEATTQLTFTVKETPAQVDNITAISGALEGAQIWLRGLDNTILGVTGENLANTTIEPTFTVTSKDNSVPADFLGENPIKALGHTWQDITSDTVTLYINFDKGFNTVDWDFELDCSIKVTTENGTYTVKGKFHNKEYVIGDVVYTPKLFARATTTSLKMGGDAATVTLTPKYFDGEIEYSASASDEDVLTITNNNNETFTIAPKAVGNTTVTFQATSGDQTATAELSFEVKEAPTTVENISATSGRIEGAQFWLEGLDNTKLGITGANLSTTSIRATITTSSSDNTIAEAYLGENKILVTSHTWQAITDSTVTLYCGLNMGLNADWDITWDISIAIDAPNGSFNLTAQFVKTAFSA